MTTRDMVFIALFAAIMGALAVFPPVTLPMIGVPITAQSMGVMLAGGVLGAWRGAAAILLFLGLVAIGLPLLPGGHGGFGVFFGPTAGFLIGFVPAAFVTGLLVERFWNRLGFPLAALLCFGGGVLVLYAFGVPWIAVSARISPLAALTGSLVFIPGDIVKCLIAASVIMTVRRSYPVISR
ncbi:biotin transporter BioY [Pontibaca methylaminivorans]|uniref:Biotin transporter n=1 Tax=Pontibaca methylaminivorans TaxID=515897 RepID=A0A1R3WMK8_9RHOB|nr:biotin transporter BioY [Pontibaca methylaminivorans]SIT77863.1 biotin transport system substrate-specific component [Pontibaca methylaminivorans]